MSRAMRGAPFAAAGGFAPPPPAPMGKPPAPPKAFLSRMRDAFKSKKASEPLLGQVTPAKEAAPRRVRGRITRQKGRAWIVEFVATGQSTAELEWTPGGAAFVVSGSHRVRATIDAAQTTRAGHIAAGQTVRLVLTLDEDCEGADTIEVDDLVIEV